MYKCNFCNKVSSPKEPLHRIVVETRDVSYVNQVRNEETDKLEELISYGFEIVREMNSCNTCKEKYNE